jgi:ribosome-associated toxin RatA of RatAB toxin-antitoxin module
MKSVSFVLLFVCCIAARPRLSASTNEGTWTEAGVKRGVRLAFRENLEWAAREVRAEKLIDFPARRVFAVVCDLSHYAEFMPGITNASILEGTVPTDFVAYLRYAPQFVVVAARDVILHVRGISDSDGSYRCMWSGVPDRVPPRSNAVRMPLNVGAWTIEPVAEDRARLTYRVAVRPGGRIPDWLVRWAAVRALPEAIEVVEKRLAAVQ